MKDFFPKVSFIVPVEGVSKSTFQSINNLLEQTHKNIEIIVIGTKDDIDIIKNKFQDKCIYKIMHTFEINDALNNGIRESNGEFISFLFNDDLIKEDVIEKELIAFSKAKENTGFVFVNPVESLTSNEKEKIEKGEFPILLLLNGNLNSSSFLFRKEIFNEYKFNNKKTLYVEYLLLEIIKKYKTSQINDQAIETTKKKQCLESELVQLWKEVLNKVTEKELICNYESLHNLYLQGIETFNQYGLIFPKCLHDQIIKNKFNPLISVIIPVYNGSNYVKEAIQSILNQTYDHYELIVVEDGSTDGGLTKDCIMEFKDKLNYYYKENGGVGSALNYGIKKAKGQYISWLSHDDFYYPEKLQMQVDALNEVNDKNTIVFSNFQLMDENGIPYVDTNFHKRFEVKELENKIFPVLNGTTNGDTILIPKVAFETCGYFDESQRTTNDYIMWFNIFKVYPTKFLKEHLVKYRVHKKQDTQSSPIYIPECEELWTSVFKKITKKEIESYGYSELEFYAKFYMEMKLGKFLKTADYLEEQYKKIYKKNGPLVTVIMPCYNSEKFLKEAIDSVLNQHFVAFELICVDDSSTDNTYQMLKEYEKQDFRIRVLKNNHKKGVSGAMNTGLDNARGDFITRMDSDDISYPDQLMKEFNFLKKHKEYGIVTVNIDLRKNGKVISKCSYFNDDTPIEWKYLWDNPYPNAPSMFRREIVKDVRFNEDLSVAEDYQFFMKISPHKIYFIDEVHYSYRINDNSLYHSNSLKSINNSLEVASNYYYEITKKEHLPELYYYLSFFSGEMLPSSPIDRNDILEFIDDTLDCFRKHFKWTEKEYNAARAYSINYIYSSYIEKTVRNKSYEVQEYRRMIKSISWKVTKPIRFTKRIITKGKKVAKRVMKRG